MRGSVPILRVRNGNSAPVNTGGRFVLYWMIANRRARWNYSLDRAIDWAEELDKPLVVLEALRCGYEWACDRFHHFILRGMADNARQFKGTTVSYYPYVEPAPDAGKGLLETVASEACVVVTDDFPAFFLPDMIASASKKVPVLMELVDANGLLPMRAADRVFPTAHAFRRFLQKHLPGYFTEYPRPFPFRGLRVPRLRAIPRLVRDRWPPADSRILRGSGNVLARFPIDHRVSAIRGEGGATAAGRRLEDFLAEGLLLYDTKRNAPEVEVTSGLSPYLHFGHIGVHQIFHKIMKSEDWFFDRISPRTTGSRTGWWGMRPSAEAFLDQLVTWRELGFNMCWQRNDYAQYESLPSWALDTLRDHEGDERPYLYPLERLASADTHDPLWNAAQTQLVREGRMHNYLRMLWGKKILQWTPSPRDALRIMIALNNRYALDGRDPNSYSGIFWVLGRYDRAWGPERSVFGKIRYMSSRNTARKVSVRGYMERYS
ncbi:MAG: deoxyribodipyrimidine photolyase [Deltaproteobacteria bacterium]|nr:deoxyribodipyrimidine photolyase [Deltaproteobacteria bacterium]